MASSSVSATSLRFAQSLTLCSKTTLQASSRFGAVSVGWSRRSFPSLRSSRFRICAAQPETVDKVCEIVRKQLALPPESQLTPETTFTALGADSLDTVEIVMGLEEEFGISVEEQSSENITCIKEAADLIDKLLQNKTPPS
uniref:Acyl carrier protein n=1 Tax=Arachis hypogaea TaxID=3818 RepID=E6YBQ1_ARAHY|nr:acyl carrier protein 4 [Arachis hypogaea]ADB94677.1 acyl carrier protein 4 [Arachis hypogaea]